MAVVVRGNPLSHKASAVKGGPDLQNVPVLVVAPDTQIAKDLSARIQECGFPVLGALTTLEARSAGLRSRPAILILKVRPGHEMHAYYIGNSARQMGTAVVVISADSDSPVVNALVPAIPDALLLKWPCSDDILRDTLVTALYGVAPKPSPPRR
jgi:hypothetical protein